MTPPDDLLKRAKAAIAIRGTGNAGLRGQQDVADFARDLVAALESDRAHILKLTALLDDSHACSDDCDLVPILAWVDPADKARCREMVREDRALLRRIVEAVAEGYVLRQPDNGVHYCRSCSAKSPEWEHNSACRIELHKKAIREFHLLIDEARARVGEK